MRNIIIPIIALILSACSVGQATNVLPSATIESVVTSTSIPISTFTVMPTETSMPTNTPELSPTLTPTQLPDLLKNEILQAYKILLFVQINANLLKETAIRVNSGELSGFESFGTVVAVASLVNAVDEAIAENTPPKQLQIQWDKALDIHSQTKDILSRWFNKEIDSSVVLTEIEGPVIEIEDILSSVDKELSKMYGFDLDELQKVRDEAIVSINQIFNTPTPTP